MMLKELVLKNRSYRRFKEQRNVSESELKDLVELARTSASAANRQPLKFILSFTKERNDIIFPKLAWAGYLSHWNGPIPGERPGGYIIILGDTTIHNNYYVDHGIAAQSILLGAVEKGLGGCMIAAIDRKALADDLGIPQNFEILLVIALGEPIEEVVIEPVKDGDIKYYRDEKGVHHVPKRSLDDLLV